MAAALSSCSPLASSNAACAFAIACRRRSPSFCLTAVGAAAGAATGGIVGALTEAGVSAEDAHSYAEGVRRGGTLVSTRVADADRLRLDSILNESAVNLRDRSAAWQKAGWKSFDPARKPYNAEEIKKERQLYGGALR
jgi:hypothetical protein